MKTRIKIGLLVALQISVILLTMQFLDSTHQSNSPTTFVQQGISKVPTSHFSQNEKFEFKPYNEKSSIISDTSFFALVSTVSSLVLIMGVMKILQTENTKKNQTEKLAILGELAARIAHDMRNPLSVVQMTLENFKMKYGLNEDQQRQFDKITRSIFRITHQIDDIWDFVKSPIIKKKLCSLDSILQYSLSRITIPPNIKMHLPSNDCEILCDDEVIPIVFVNIFINAIQELGNGGNIWVSFDSDKNWFIIKIEDDGAGIEPEILDKIFEPLITTKQTGTGLGLASCKSIMESHGGFIEASNRLEKGTMFSIHLPK